MPAGIGSSRSAAQGDAAGGERQISGVEVDRLEHGFGRLPYPPDTGNPLQRRERGAGIDVVLLLCFETLGIHVRYGILSQRDHRGPRNSLA